MEMQVRRLLPEYRRRFEREIEGKRKEKKRIGPKRKTTPRSAVVAKSMFKPDDQRMRFPSLWASFKNLRSPAGAMAAG